MTSYFFSEGVSVSDNNQVLLNTGGDQYQTVTIVPSDGHTGEVNLNFLVDWPINNFLS